MNKRHILAVLALVLTGLAAAGTGSAAIIDSGVVYKLNNHPDGALNPPPYGLRLDGLFSVPDTTERFTFDFENAQSLMQLVWDDAAGTIAISGKSYGGRDKGTAYATGGDAGAGYTGLYMISFLYTGVTGVPSDDDLWVKSGNTGISGHGTITFLGADGAVGGAGANADITRYLMMKADGSGLYFRLGDENDDEGHRDFDGISGWGWLQACDGYSPTAVNQYSGCRMTTQDWIFTLDPDGGGQEIPEPSTYAMMASGLLAAGLLKRRSRR